MTNFDRMKQSKTEMANTILVLVAGYFAQVAKKTLSTEELVKFVLENHDIMVKWLDSESEEDERLKGLYEGNII